MVQLSTPAATGRHNAHTLAGVLHLWRRDASQGAWRAVELPEEGVALCRSVERDLRARGDAGEHICALIVPFEEAGATRAVLLTSPCSDGAVLRNGAPVLGVVILDQELDEISVCGETVYLSARGPVASAPFPGGDEIRCADVEVARTRSHGFARLERPLETAVDEEPHLLAVETQSQVRPLVPFPGPLGGNGLTSALGCVPDGVRPVLGGS